MKIHDYMLEELLAPNPPKMNKKDYNKLTNTFEQVKNRESPSVMEQLENKHPSRKLIDKTWLEILGYKGKTDQLLDQLYESLAKK